MNQDEIDKGGEAVMEILMDLSHSYPKLYEAMPYIAAVVKFESERLKAMRQDKNTRPI
jgi:hypothetical protein